MSRATNSEKLTPPFRLQVPGPTARLNVGPSQASIMLTWRVPRAAWNGPEDCDGRKETFADDATDDADDATVGDEGWPI
ncbi:MAG TPA: hypothetical protein VGZ27_03230 [Vicinamibacterales bacterium]|nr:hypothetical protein [Vicinamibacterales bacterium]